MSHPGPFRQHLLPFDAIESITFRQDLSPNLNRYLMRTTDMDLCEGKTASFVYSKLGRFVILGFIRQDRPNQWQGRGFSSGLAKSSHASTRLTEAFLIT